MANDLRVQAELITAVFDLKVVQSIRGAIRANLLKKGGREGPLGNIENPKPPPSLPNFGEQRHAGILDRQPVLFDAPIARRRAVETIDPCECRSTPRSTDVGAPLPNLIPADDTLPTSDAERASGVRSRRESPLVPPWEMPLPIVAPPAIRVVKYQAARADQNTKGRLLDFVM